MKYELTNIIKEVNGVTLHRIKALKTFEGVTLGDLGGWIEKEDNLSHNGNAWVSGNAKVSGNVRVSGNALVYDNAIIFKTEHYCTFGGFGSQQRTTTAFRDSNINVRICCGCFTGSIDEFKKQVKKTHPVGSKHRKTYLKIADLIELQLDFAS